MTRLIAWSGGALFVTSIALCAWWYFVTLAIAVPRTGWRSVIVDTLLLTVFATHHSLFAREPVKRRLSAVPPAMRRSFYVWIASMLLIAVVRVWKPVGGDLYHVTGLLALFHAAVQLAGIWLIARAVAGLDPLELAGIRQASNSVLTKEPLQVAGPYRWVRHPLYLGWMLALFGTAHMTGDRFLFAVVTSAYLVVAVRWEERALKQSFGEEYSRYAARVQWRIIPFVY